MLPFLNYILNFIVQIVHILTKHIINSLIDLWSEFLTKISQVNCLKGATFLLLSKLTSEEMLFFKEMCK